MVATSVVWVGLGGLGYWLIYRGSPDFVVSVDHPPIVTVGETFKLKVTVENGGTKNIRLSELDVSDDLLKGFEVISISPKPKGKSKFFGINIYDFSRKIKSGEKIEIEFKLKAKDVGLWLGNVDACTPTQNFVTHYVEIEVINVPAPTGAE